MIKFQKNVTKDAQKNRQEDEQNLFYSTFPATSKGPVSTNLFSMGFKSETFMLYLKLNLITICRLFLTLYLLPRM